MILTQRNFFSTNRSCLQSKFNASNERERRLHWDRTQYSRYIANAQTLSSTRPKPMCIKRTQPTKNELYSVNISMYSCVIFPSFRRHTRMRMSSDGIVRGSNTTDNIPAICAIPGNKNYSKVWKVRMLSAQVAVRLCR